MLAQSWTVKRIRPARCCLFVLHYHSTYSSISCLYKRLYTHYSACCSLPFNSRGNFVPLGKAPYNSYEMRRLSFASRTSGPNILQSRSTSLLLPARSSSFPSAISVPTLLPPATLTTLWKSSPFDVQPPTACLSLKLVSSSIPLAVQVLVSFSQVRRMKIYISKLPFLSP